MADYLRTAAGRRRRTRAEAETEILDAAERFLEERSWHELTVENVMALTTMTRMAFYDYFDDRRGLFLRLLERTGEDLAEIMERWLQGKGELYDDALATLTGTAELYRRQGRLIYRLAGRCCSAPGTRGPDSRGRQTGAHPRSAGSDTAIRPGTRPCARRGAPRAQA